MKKLIILLLVNLISGGSLFSQQPKGNFKKNYQKDCAACTDPWVGDAFYKIWGVCPSPYGGGDYNCGINNWNNGSWTSYENLTNIIRNKYTGSRSQGRAFIFIKPENVNFKFGSAGHIGWGFMLSDGRFYCGATENYAKGDIRTYLVLAGYDNDFWSELCQDENDMFRKMKSLGYTQYKWVGVNNPKIRAAKIATEEVQNKGFQGISNNCLDHVYTVLAAYGLGFWELPSRQVFIFPNKWFGEFYQKVGGNGIYGHNL